MIILKATKNQCSTISLKDAFLEKPRWRRSKFADIFRVNQPDNESKICFQLKFDECDVRCSY